MKTKKIQFEQEIANEDLAKVMGGTSCSKISVTISLAQATLAAEAKKQKDSDSDAESDKITSQTMKSK